MYTNLIIASLLQVVLAQHINRTRPFHRLHFNSEHQFNFRNPDSEIGAVNHDTQHRIDGYSTYRPRSNGNYDKSSYYESPLKNDENNSHKYGSEQEHYHREHIERSELRIKENQRQNIIKNRSGSTDLDDSNYDNVLEMNSKSARESQDVRNYRSRADSTRKNDHTLGKQDTLKTNLDFQLNTSDQSTKYNKPLTADPHPRGSENEVTANKNSTNTHFNNSGFATPSFRGRGEIAYNKAIQDGYSEVRNNNDSITFNDAPEPIAWNKTSVGKEVRYSENDNNSKEDKWVWDKPSTTSVPNETKTTDFNIDDRLLFDVDSCPDGKTKVAGVCVPKH